MNSIVIDKSYLQGTKADQIRRLTVEHRFLMSDALFYELLTTEPVYRCQCFNKFPDGSNPVDLINHIGTLMKIEIETQKASGLPSQNIENIEFTFNEQLTREDYSPPLDVQEEIDEETSRLESSVHSFLERTKVISSFFPDLLQGNQTGRDKSHMEAEALIVAPQSLMPLLNELKPPKGEKALPPAATINDNWAIYRWLQVQLLFALDVHVRYQGNVLENLSTKVFTRMEHDVLDAELLALGCLEGNFATRENKHKRWWKLLCPSGELYE
jgi:hypothetical protein